MHQVSNLFSGEHYFLEEGSEVVYQGFSPSEGHVVRYVPDTKGEFVLEHKVKFYKKD